MKEFTLSEATGVLTSYVQFKRDEYMIFAHQPGVCGTVTLKGGTVLQWEIEPGYAAVVTAAGKPPVYLLSPELSKKKR